MKGEQRALAALGSYLSPKKEKKIDVELLCNTVHYYFMEGPCERNRKWLEQLYTAEGRKLAGFYEENED